MHDKGIMPNTSDMTPYPIPGLPGDNFLLRSLCDEFEDNNSKCHCQSLDMILSNFETDAVTMVTLK